jgi:hypothetical protein
VFRSRRYAEAFGAAVVGLVPGATVEPARLSPAEGAALLAVRAAGRPLTDALRAVLVSSSRVLPEP